MQGTNVGGKERHVPSQPSEAAIICAMKRSERFIVVTPICDGHDVAAVAVSRLLRREGAEAVYIGFNKSARQIVKAAAEEDATGIAISTYNGGHASFLREVLREQQRYGIPRTPLFVGGGGTILAAEVGRLERMGVAKVYRPPLDLTHAVRDMIGRAAGTGMGNLGATIQVATTHIQNQGAARLLQSCACNLQ